MTLSLKNSFRLFILCSAAVVCTFVPQFVAAQTGQVLSVTPPLIQNIVDPGDVWKSQIKVVNPNPNELTVYVEKKLFTPTGESGRGTFHDVVEDPGGATLLPDWIDITTEAITVPAEQSEVVEFKSGSRLSV